MLSLYGVLSLKAEIFLTTYPTSSGQPVPHIPWHWGYDKYRLGVETDSKPVIPTYCTGLSVIADTLNYDSAAIFANVAI